MTPALRASRASESFVHLFKGGGVQRQSLWPRSAERGIPLYAHKSAGGGLRGNPRRGFPPFIYASTCAPILWEVIFTLSCLSTPFLWCLPKETVSSRQRKAPFLPWRLHHSRERYKSVVGTFLARLGGGGLCVCAVLLGKSCRPLLPIPPHFFALAQRNGVEPQRNALLGAATGAVGSHPPLPRTRSPNVTADCVRLT